MGVALADAEPGAHRRLAHEGRRTGDDHHFYFSGAESVSAAR